MTSINRLTNKPSLEDKDLIPVWDAESGRTRNIAAESLKDYIPKIQQVDIPHLVSGTYSAGTLTLDMSDGSKVDVSGWTDLTGINFKEDGSELGMFRSVNFMGSGVQAVRQGDDLEVTIKTAAVAPTLALQFSGIYDDLQALKDAIPSPTDNQQAIALKPSEKYYHGVGGSWVELAPVGSFHPNYLGAYDTVDDLKAAEPSPSDDSLAIVGTTAKSFYIYTSGDWSQVTHTDLPSIDARLTDNEAKTKANADSVQALQAGQQVLQSNINQKISGIHLEDTDGNAFDDINGIVFEGAEVQDDQGTGLAHVVVSPKITVANGQEPGSTSLTGNALIFPDATITADPNDPKVLTVGRTDTPKFDESMFQSAVDNGYAPDDAGLKRSNFKVGWSIVKDIKQVSGRPSGSVGDLIVFKQELDNDNPALRHTFMMAIGKDLKLNNQVWFMYKDGSTWSPWFSVEGENQAKIDAISSSVNELKQGQAAALNELKTLQTAAGNLYAPDKATFDKATNALIQAALKDYSAKHSGQGGDKADIVYPRFYAAFSNSRLTSLSGVSTSTTGELTLVRIPATASRIFIYVENDNDEASKIKGFSFNDSQKMSLQPEDAVIDGKKYKAYYTSGGFTEKQVEIKIDFGQGI